SCYSVFVTSLRPPTPTLFPYTTLFRSNYNNNAGVHCLSSLYDTRYRNAGREASLPTRQICGMNQKVNLARSSNWLLFRGRATERSEEHTSELQSRFDLVCRHLLEKKKY